MSRFSLDKFMAFVEGSDDAVRSYVADPREYVLEWERRAQGNRLPTPDSGSFTADERRALTTRSHADLYQLGAHPYLLWHFVEATRVWTGEVPWPEMKERFREDIAGFESPGYRT